MSSKLVENVGAGISTRTWRLLKAKRKYRSLQRAFGELKVLTFGTASGT